MPRALIALFSLSLAAPALAADPGKKPQWFDQAVSAFAVTCEPAEAKRGEVVTLKIRLELKDGYTVYPLTQADPGAAGMASKVTFPKPGKVVFVGEAADPKGAKVKAEPELGIAELKYYTGKVVWERRFVVNPDAEPGELAVTLPSVKFAICDARSCFPPKGFEAAAKLKVLGGPPVPVEAKYAGEVAKALSGK